MRGLKLFDTERPILPGRRTPLGVRGLKHDAAQENLQRARRTPLGVRGLKQERLLLFEMDKRVAPRSGCVD